MSNSRVVNGITVVPISGKDYVPVHERVRLVHDAKKDFEMVESQPIQVGDRWVWRVVCLIDGKRYWGSAEIHLNARPGSADATDPFAVAETSAVGRCLGFAGWGSVESICSADELLRVQPGPQITVVESAATRTTKPLLPQPQTDDAVKARLNQMFQSGKAQNLFQHKRGMAAYASQILGRQIGMDELLDLNEQDLQTIEDALNGTGLEQAS
jgi:hypothetical protein